MTKITSLTAKTTMTGTDNIPIIDNDSTPTTKKATLTNLFNSFPLDSLSDVSDHTPTKGKILVGDGDSWEVLTVGSNDQALVADSSQTLGVKWGAVSSSFVMLDNHEASGSENTYTYTPSSALSFDTYSMIIVEWDTVVDGALTLEMRVNGVTGSAYKLSGNRNNGSTNTVYNQSSASYWQLASTTLLVGNGYPSTGYVIIQANPDIGGLRNTRVQIKGMSYGDEVATWELFAGHLTTNPTENSEITSITILTSANNMKAKSRITTYGVKRS